MYARESLAIVREKENTTFPILEGIIKLLEDNKFKPFSICDSNAVRAFSKFKRSSHDFDIIFPKSTDTAGLVKQFPTIKYKIKVNDAEFYRMETMVRTLNQPSPFYFDFHIAGYILDNIPKAFLVDSIFFDSIQYKKIYPVNNLNEIVVPVPKLEELFLLKIRKFFQLDCYDLVSMLIDNKIDTDYIYKRTISLQIYNEVKIKLSSLLELTNSEGFLDMWNNYIFYTKLKNSEYEILTRNLSKIAEELNGLGR